MESRPGCKDFCTAARGMLILKRVIQRGKRMFEIFAKNPGLVVFLAACVGVAALPFVVSFGRRVFWFNTESDDLDLGIELTPPSIGDPWDEIDNYKGKPYSQQ